MPSITKISALKTTSIPEPIYTIWLSISGYDKKKHRVILRVNNSFYDIDYNSLHIDLRVFPKNETLTSIFPFVNKTMRIYALLYDFTMDKIVDTKLQEFYYNSISQTYYASDKLFSTSSAYLNGYWVKTKRVVKVEGPFDATGEKVKSIIKGEHYFYKATPNKKLKEADLLSMKWSYQYDDNEVTNFENQNENTIGIQNIMSCTFHKDKEYKEVKVYAYFIERSEKVMAAVGVHGEVKILDSGQEGVIIIEEARVRAFLRMLRIGEGTDGVQGYTKLFGGKDFTKPPFNKDMSDHPRIKRPFGKKKSSAAGAYQVMGYTWDDDDMIKKRKKYNINDFSPANQDKFAVILLKYKRAATAKKPSSLLDLIIKNEIEKGLKWHGSYEWASLPPGRYGQPAKTMEQALKLYEYYLKEELSGKTDLFLKNGFLKEFGYKFNYKDAEGKAQKQDSTIPPANEDSYETLNDEKLNIDLRDKNKNWQTQFDKKFGNEKQQRVACWRACKEILNNFGVSGGDLIDGKALYQIAIESDNKLIVNKAIAKQSISYLNQQLEKGNPVLVGVDHTYKYKGGFNNDATTDHFVVIVGRGSKEKKVFYRFYEVGTSFKAKGISNLNVLFVQDDYSLKGSTAYTSKHIYTVTQIRKNL